MRTLVSLCLGCLELAIGQDEAVCSIHSGGATYRPKKAIDKGTTPSISCETPEAARAPLRWTKRDTAPIYRAHIAWRYVLCELVLQNLRA